MEKNFFHKITKKYSTKYTGIKNKLNKLTLITLDIILLLWIFSLFLIKIKPYVNLLLIIEAVLAITSTIFIVLDANIRKMETQKENIGII